MTPTPAEPELPRAWLARAAVRWSRQARAERLPELEAALLAVAAEATDAALAELRRCVTCRHEHEPGTTCCTICGYSTVRLP